MSKLTAKRKNALPKSPQVKKGNLSPAEKARVVAKANRILNGQGG